MNISGPARSEDNYLAKERKVKTFIPLNNPEENAVGCVFIDTYERKTTVTMDPEEARALAKTLNKFADLCELSKEHAVTA